MLLEFSVGNFRSFKEPVTLSMVAAKLSSLDTQLDQNNTFKVNDTLTLLTSAAIYGANASGKSNLIKALSFMRWFVLNSSKESQANDPIHSDPFLLDAETEGKPSFFEIVFLLEGIPYRYGFEVTVEKVETEWLFYSPSRRETKLFVREGNEITSSRSFKGRQFVASLTRSNALFLSVAAQFNNLIATKVLSWFTSFNVISGLNDSAYGGFTVKMFTENSQYRSSILDLIQGSDVSIDDVLVEKINIHDPKAFPKNMPKEVKEMILKQIVGDEVINFRSIHNKKCRDGTFEKVEFDISEESEGTQKLFYLSGPIIDTLAMGKVLFIDEIEARMHTMLTRKLIALFNSKKTNPNHAQLIFATHDTNLLSNKFLRRDQIWFMEEDEFRASHLYSLAELKVRKDRTFENDYLEGRYGGVPVLGDMRQTLIQQGEDDEHESE
jgi:uncharacterized protein